MADKRGRELQRALATGDVESSLQLASHGARTNKTELLTEGLLNAVSLLGLNELQELHYAAAKEIERKTQQDKEDFPKKYKYEKAIEFASTELGKVSLGEFVAAIEDFVKKCKDGSVGSEYVYRTLSGYSHLSEKHCTDKALEVFNKYVGNFVISSSSPIRIYAVKEELSPEEKALKERALQKTRLEKELKAQKDSRDKLVKQLEKQKRREARLKKKLEEMDA